MLQQKYVRACPVLTLFKITLSIILMLMLYDDRDLTNSETFPLPVASIKIYSIFYFCEETLYSDWSQTLSPFLNA